MTEDQMRDLFRDLRDEPVSSDSLRRVRVAVSEKTAARPRTFWSWVMAASLVAACAALVMIIQRSESPVKETAPPVVVQKQDIAPPVVEVKPPSVPRKMKVHQVRHTRKVQKDESNVVIRIETADPDVVILLLGD